ncbi:hypothetical protein BU251_00805 [Candidatus Velamenicoccus archaeovorus]|uniref:4Fe-4S ferredoxin-type domain-containing protein n=1 Tax=Velamenicoccus archaeovorus TaxID=1930593 RepID=A0A410P2F2_VELA1|nr:DUF362 domain-containing protein [Candidatus Velamenicoccus archaeovorus]QAT16375.1 hypothetical protein BU251_00805 [Candidatus Velamenicoccus archaeovorus]
MKSKVYLAPIAEDARHARQAALVKVLDALRPAMQYDEGAFVPIKLTIGDSACVHHMPPELVRLVVEVIRAQGARPFLFDTSVIYHGSRQNAVDHMGLAYKKGFHQAAVGAPFIVADGLLGHDGREYEINAAHIKKIRVPSFVGILENLVVLSHATGHVFSGYAGAIKNVAMGMSCRPTKQVQHSSLKPSIAEEKCTACGACIRSCPVNAIVFGPKRHRSPGLGHPPFAALAGSRDGKRTERAIIDTKKCIGCGECLCACRFEAVLVNWDEEMDVFCSRMVEAAAGILSRFKKKVFITFAFGITQDCDCISTKDDKLISPDIGILASQDPLALDQATTDLMKDAFGFLKQHQAYRGMFRYAQKTGLGSLEYELEKI